MRARVADGTAVTQLSPDVLSVTATPKGPCQVLHVQTTGLLSPLTYTSLYCPTPTGGRDSLVSRADFAAYTAEWSVQPDGDGTRVRVYLELRLPLPHAILRSHQAAAAKTMLTHLGEWVHRRRLVLDACQER